MQKNKYFILLLLACLFWAGNFVFSKSLVQHASPLTLTALKWFIAAICLFPLVWWKEKKILPPRNALLPMLLMGITGVVFFQLFLFLALAHTTASNVGLLSTLNMISIAIFSAIFLKEKMNFLQVVSMMVSLFGVILVLTKGNIDYLLSFHFNKGDLWMLASVADWGLYTICCKWAMTKTSAMMSVFYSSIFGLMILFPFTVSDFTVTNINPSFVFSALYTGVVATVIAMVLWNISIQKLGSTLSGVFLNVIPVFTSILAFLLLKEKMTWIQGIGSAIVITGCFLFSYFKQNRIVKFNQYLQRQIGLNKDT